MLTLLRNRPWLAYAPIIIAPFLLFGIPLISGKVMYWGTVGLQFVPWREYAYTQLDQGVLPLWNPLNGMGAPLLANYQLAFFYPPGWLTIIGHWISGAAGVAWVYTLLVPLHLAWAGFGMVVLLKSLGVRRLGQVVAGLAFGLGGFFIARATFFSMVWAGAWLPWVIWAASGIGSPFSVNTDKKRLFWLTLCVGAMLLAGHAQLSWYILLFAGFWVFFGLLSGRGIKQALIGSSIYVGLVAAGVLLAGIQLAPTFEYLLQSQRAAAYDYDLAMTYSFWPWRFLTFLSSELFGNPGLGDYWGYGAYWEDAVYLGVIPFLLSLRTIPGLFKSGNIHRRGYAFLWGMILISCLFALGSNTPIFPWLFKNVPSFELYQAPARWMILTVACLCLLAGFSIDHWQRPEGRARRNLNLLTFGFFAVLIGAAAGSLLLPDLKPGLMRGFMIFGVAGGIGGLLGLHKPAGEQKPRWVWSAAVVVILILDLTGAALFLNTFISGNFYQPQDLSAGSFIRQMEPGRLYISPADEYDLKFSKYLKFNDTRYTCDYADIRLDLFPNINLLDGIPSANNFDPFVPNRFDTWMKAVANQAPGEREKSLAFMGVSAVVELDDSGLSTTRALDILPDGLIEGYSCATIVAKDKEALVETLMKVSQGNAAEPCIILEGSSAKSTEFKAGAIEISAVEQRFDRVKFRVDSANPTWLRIGSTWYPGWRAQVDGNDTSVFHADYLFSGIQVPAGRHEVVYYYRPSSLIMGLLMTFTGVLAIIFTVWLNANRSKSREKIQSNDITE